MEKRRGEHIFQVFKQSKYTTNMNSKTELLGDSGYQGYSTSILTASRLPSVRRRNR